MSTIEAMRQSAFAVVPLAGQLSVSASSVTAASLDFATLGPQGQRNDNNPTRLGAVGLFVSIAADTQPVYVVAGPTLASVTGSNAPSSSAVGTNATGLCWKIEAGQSLRYKVSANSRFLGFVSAATGGFVRIGITTYQTGS